MKRLFHYIGRRGAIFGFLGFVALVIGLGNLNQPVPPQAAINAQYLIDPIPLEFWYLVWTITGAVCTVSVFMKQLRMWATAMFSFVCGLFALGYTAAQLFGEGVMRAWVSAILYAGLAMVMLVVAGWREDCHPPNGGGE